MAMDDICMAQPIVEVIGSYMLSNQTEAAKSGVFKRYVLALGLVLSASSATDAINYTILPGLIHIYFSTTVLTA